jgi:large subunit ribosomal protein L2
MSGPDAPVRNGNMLPLNKIPLGTLVHAVEMSPGGGAKLARSAGNGAQLMALESGFAVLKMPSGEMRRVLESCWGTVGTVGHEEWRNVSLGKAGRKRWLGVRPTVRGTVMNPVDHPHGGGEGRNKNAGGHPVSPWGVPAKGGKTRKKKPSDKHIIRRRKK